MDQGVALTQRTDVRSFLETDDAWAIASALAIIVASIVCFAVGSRLPAFVAVLPPKWTNLPALLAQLGADAPRYVVQLSLWLVVVVGSLRALGFRPIPVALSFAVIWLVSLVLIVVGQWSEAVRYNLEPPLLALLAGLVLGNARLLPPSFEEGFRVEFFIKLGVVLLGATLPLSLLIWAGPVALGQASIVSVVTFVVIFVVARAVGLDPRFAAVLGAGGAICGVSAAIAIAAAVGARRTDAGVVISIVIVWAIVMIFALPFAAAALHLPAAVGGAWIGTSEFADAAGFAAAQAYDGMTAHTAAGASGASATGPAVAAFTLLKVVGRDVWIGIWAVLLSLAFAFRADQAGIKQRTRLGEIWIRFPKFVLGFLAASVLLTLVAAVVGHTAFAKHATPALLTPLKNLRIWAFAFGFLAIGLTIRAADLRRIAGRPLLAFSAGAVVNVVLGFVLSTVVFGAYWTAFGR